MNWMVHLNLNRLNAVTMNHSMDGYCLTMTGMVEFPMLNSLVIVRSGRIERKENAKCEIKALKYLVG